MGKVFGKYVEQFLIYGLLIKLTRPGPKNVQVTWALIGLKLNMEYT